MTTGQRVIHAARAVLTTGPWLPGMARGAFGRAAAVYRQTLHWFRADDPAAYAPGRFPVFIWMHGTAETDYLYGFPAMPGATGVKVATEQYAGPVDPDAVDRTVTRAESDALFDRHVSGRLRGVTSTVERAAACLYTVTPDRGFIIDSLPGHPGVIAASACSGHGFKHSAAVGELLASRAVGADGAEAGPFGLGRFAA